MFIYYRDNWKIFLPNLQGYKTFGMPRVATLCGYILSIEKRKRLLYYCLKGLNHKFFVVSLIIWIKGKQSSVGSFRISDICLQFSIKPVFLCILFQLLSFSDSSSFFIVFKCCFFLQKNVVGKVCSRLRFVFVFHSIQSVASACQSATRAGRVGAARSLCEDCNLIK